jgi:ACS family glucarate transporter-like MFS transporter
MSTNSSAPKELIGLNGGLFTLFGNIAGITIPPAIGNLVRRTGSYDDVLIFVGASALLAIFSYVVIVGDIKRLELHSSPQIAAI